MLTASTVSVRHSHIPARMIAQQEVDPAQIDKFAAHLHKTGYRDLRNMGIVLDQAHHSGGGYGMDSLVGSLTTPSISAAIQFAQTWLAGMVKVLTSPRVIDELTGLTTIGRWEDEQVVQTILEHSGAITTYGDHTNTPRSNWNTNFEYRTNVRTDTGMFTGRLESERSALMNISTEAEKREAVMETLEIFRNRVGFIGFNSGNDRTYGILNDPNLPAYVNLPNGSGGTPTWATKNFKEITNDIRTMLAALRKQSKNLVDPFRDNMTLAIPVEVADFLTTTSDIGFANQTVKEWIGINYPNLRVVVVPSEFTAANGGVSVVYLYAENLRGNSTDNGLVFDQIVPAKSFLVGTKIDEKITSEAWSSATAGVICKRPIGVVRYSGVA